MPNVANRCVTMKADVHYIGLVDILGDGLNWYLKARKADGCGGKVWRVRAYIPWDDKRRYYYTFEMNESTIPMCCYYPTDEKGERTGDYITGNEEKYKRCTRNNLFEYMNDVIESKWHTEEARNYRGI